MKSRRSPEHLRAVLERRRSSAAAPRPSGKVYRRRDKHNRIDHRE